MVNIHKINPMLRAVGVIGTVAAMVTGVTFAALQSSATLTNSSVSTVTAGLNIWDGDSYETTAPGFTVTNLVPGVGSPQRLYVQNSGGTSLKLTARVPNTPPPPTDGYGFNGFENLKVTIKGDACIAPIATTMQALLAGEVELPCNPLAAGAQGDSSSTTAAGNYTVTFDIDPSSITGSKAGVGDFNIILTGSAPTPVIST